MSRSDEAKQIRAWAGKSKSASALKAAVELAQTEPGIPVAAEEFDKDQWLLNLPNGVLDLRRGELGPHRRELLMTQRANVSYETGAKCPRFLEFLYRNSNGRPDLVRFKARMYGSALTGSIRDQKLFILYGSGANGKSTEATVLTTLLGDYACQTASQTLIKRSPDGASNDIARLRAKRMAVANETEAGEKLAAARLKQMTGGEVITARMLYQEFVEIEPTWKIFLSTNHLPTIDGADAALARRLVMVPYDVVIPERERDPDLKEKLLAEGPGILNWLIEGCLEWQAIGLNEPDCVRRAVEAYRADSDPVGAWIEECCEVGDFRTSASELFMKFESWCFMNGRERVNATRFGTVLGQKGFQKVKSGTTFRIGLRLKPGRLH